MTVSPPSQAADSKHTAATIQAVTLSPGSRQACLRLEQILGQFRTPGLDGKAMLTVAFCVDGARLKAVALEFAASLGLSKPSSELEEQRAVNKAIFTALALGLHEGRIPEHSVRAVCRDVSAHLEREEGYPLGCMISSFPRALQAQCDSRPGLERAINRGLVDALVRNFLGQHFTGEVKWGGLTKLHHSLCALSLERPALAVAFGHARFDHAPHTRQQQLAMDCLGLGIVESTPQASTQDLRKVSGAITREAETACASGGGLAYWQLALEPYFRGSLASSDPQAPGVMVEGALETIRDCRQAREASTARGMPANHTLNLDKVAEIFMGWVAQVAPAQRDRVRLALATSLAKVGRPLVPPTSDS